VTGYHQRDRSEGDRDEEGNLPNGRTPTSLRKRKVVTPVSAKKKRKSSSAYEQGGNGDLPTLPFTPGRSAIHSTPSSSPCPSPCPSVGDSSGIFAHEELVWLQKDHIKLVNNL